MSEECPSCKFLVDTFCPPDQEINNREYWLMTEVFVFLHEGKDYCDYNKEKEVNNDE